MTTLLTKEPTPTKNANPIRVLVVDDTATYRQIVSQILSNMPNVEVVGTAPNGKLALAKIDLLKPDIITLDLEMPEMDGLATLSELKKINSPVGVIMVSAFTTEGADTTIRALELGAFDFVLKPTSENINQSVDSLRRDLQIKINTFIMRYGRRMLSAPPSPTLAKPATVATVPLAAASTPSATTTADPLIIRRVGRLLAQIDAIVLGISTGGPQALTTMLPKLPADLPAPMLVVQHMPPMFTKSLADDLNRRCQLKVSEAKDGDRVLTGQILIAPGGKQMKVVRMGDRIITSITDDPPENNCKPAVDYLFRSVANVIGGNVLAIIMTGMGSDGTLGCRLLKRKGAAVLTQSEKSCIVYGMPRQPAEEGLSDVIAPLDLIADQITRIARGGAPQ